MTQKELEAIMAGQNNTGQHRAETAHQRTLSTKVRMKLKLAKLIAHVLLTGEEKATVLDIANKNLAHGR